MSVENRLKTRSKPNTVHYAAEIGDIKLLDYFVKEGFASGNPESVTLQTREDVLGMMPLHVACENGQHEVVEYLIKKRVDVDAGDNFRVTPLHLAAIENCADIVEEMASARANVKPADVEGDMPIHWAATKGHAEVVELLVKKGSPADTPNNKGWTPLHRAAYNGRKQACHTLIKLGAKNSAVTKDGNTPLHLACFMNHLSIIEKLCELGAHQNVLNDRNQTPMDLCITDAARDILRELGGFHSEKPAVKPRTADEQQPVKATGKVPPAMSIAAIRKPSDPKDGFPSPLTSPGSSFTIPAGQKAALDISDAFMKAALEADAGTNPYVRRA